jgi:hypothetical protein
MNHRLQYHDRAHFLQQRDNQSEPVTRLYGLQVLVLSSLIHRPAYRYAVV